MSEQRFPRGTPPDLSAAELEELRCPGCTERIARLEAQLTEAKKAAEWVPITDAQRPQLGEWVSALGMFPVRVIHKGRTAKYWLKRGYTHYYVIPPITVPTEALND